MHIKENKYHSTIKVEFKDLLYNLVYGERDKFHMYTIHRLLSLGLLIDFPFEYVKLDESQGLIDIELDLKEYGKVVLQIDTVSSYGGISCENHKNILKNFLGDFGTESIKKSNRGRLF